MILELLGKLCLVIQSLRPNSDSEMSVTTVMGLRVFFFLVGWEKYVVLRKCTNKQGDNKQITVGSVLLVNCVHSGKVIYLHGAALVGLPQWLSSKESSWNAGDTGDSSLIPGSGRSPGEENDNPLQYSCLENPMGRGAWWATVHGVTKSQTRLSAHTLLCFCSVAKFSRWICLICKTRLHV